MLSAWEDWAPLPRREVSVPLLLASQRLRDPLRLPRRPSSTPSRGTRNARGRATSGSSRGRAASSSNNLGMMITVHGTGEPGSRTPRRRTGAYLVMSNHQVALRRGGPLLRARPATCGWSPSSELFDLPMFGERIDAAGFISIDRKNNEQRDQEPRRRQALRLARGHAHLDRSRRNAKPHRQAPAVQEGRLHAGDRLTGRADPAGHAFAEHATPSPRKASLARWRRRSRNHPPCH